MIFYIKLILYGWVLVEVASLAHLYHYSVKAQPTMTMRAMFWFITAVAFETAYRFMMNYTIAITEDLHSVAKDGVILPLIFLAITAHRLRNVSIDLERLRKK